MAITAAMVKELRDSTGAGMMDAKKALTEKMATWKLPLIGCAPKVWPKLRRNPAVQRQRVSWLLNVAGGKGVAVEVNSETDFVGKNADFQKWLPDC